MGKSDLKFFVLVLVVGVGGYFAFFNMDWGRFKGGFQKRKEPTITFVPEGTEGARTLKEINEGEARAKGLRGPVPVNSKGPLPTK